MKHRSPAGFRLFFSNRMERLADSLAEFVATPLSHPFAQETILVQSRGMQRWLSMRMAEHHGICANVRFPFPVGFLYDLFQKNLEDIPEEYPFDQDRLTWQIMRLLGEFADDPRFNLLTRYVQDDPVGLRRFRLARKIAYLFDRYLIFRPAMIQGWERGERFLGRNHDDAEPWQAALWKELAKGRESLHRAGLQKRFVSRILSGTGLDLPERVAVFGISSLPPAQLQVFHALAERVPVAFFVLNPCREFWEDVVSRRRKIRILAEQPCTAYLEEGNPLLSSLGGLNQDFLKNLAQITEEDFVDLFQSPDHSSLLTSLQSDILTLTNPAGRPQRTRIDAADDSLQIHSCHSPMREVEVLSDTIYHLLERKPHLNPRDILVMAPDIETYTPYIQAVFGSPERERMRLPFSIADRAMVRHSGVIAAFFSVLETASGRLESNRVLSLLENRSVRTRFGLSETDMELIHTWVCETRIRWGADEHSRKELGLPSFRANSWEAGLDRLLLGFVLPGKGERTYQGILPFDAVEGSMGRTLGRFIEFFQAVHRLTRVVRGEHTLEAWSDLLCSVIEDFFQPEESEVSDLHTVKTALLRLRSIPAHSRYNESVGADVLVQWLKESLGASPGRGQFLAGGITFCSLIPMRAIPFPVICLLGLDHDAFPRQEVAADFDLMARKPSPGDRNLRMDDRSLFLETFLSAREHLILSHVGQDIQTNKTRPPSVLISELLDLLDRGYVMGDTRAPGDALVVRHKLQSFSSEYFAPDSSLFSYSQSRCAGAAQLFHTCDPPFLAAPLDDPPQELRTVNLAQLIRFFSNPAAFFLKNRLGVDLSLRSTRLEEEEAMAGISGLDRYRLGQETLARLDQGLAPAQLPDLARAAGDLPPFGLGEAAFEEILQDAVLLHHCKQSASGLPLPALDLDLTLGMFRITGQIHNVFEKGITLSRFTGAIKARDLLRAWILLLASSLAGGPTRAAVLCRDRTCSVLQPPQSPDSVMADLLHLYWEGMKSPVCFFPETSLAYAHCLLCKNKPPDQALAAAGRKWSSPFDPTREGEDPAVRQCFASLELAASFGETAVKVFGPLLKNRTDTSGPS